MFTFFFYDYICLFSCPQNLDFDDFFILNLDIVGSSILVQYPKKKNVDLSITKKTIVVRYICILHRVSCFPFSKLLLLSCVALLQ